MDDLISRKALLKAIASYEEYYKDKLKGVAYIKFLIRDMPTVKTEPDKDWISVKDRLPEPHECVLICTKSRIVDTDVFQEQMMPQAYFNYYNAFVTHWQPLPEPPKEEE